MREERQVLVHDLAEAEAGIEHDGLARGGGGEGSFGARSEIVHDKWRNFVWCKTRLGLPLGRSPARMHQDIAAPQLGAGSGHRRVPKMPAHVVDDLATGLDGSARRLGMV